MPKLTAGRLRKMVREAKDRKKPFIYIEDLAAAINEDAYRLEKFIYRNNLFDELGVNTRHEVWLKRAIHRTPWLNHGIHPMNWLHERLSARGETVLDAVNRIRSANGRPPLAVLVQSPHLAPSDAELVEAKHPKKA